MAVSVLLVCFLLSTYVTVSDASVEGLYCGHENCYEILDVTRESTKTEITKAYRKLARKWHPDMHRTEEKKESAAQMFQKIANAYEILKEEDSRNDYDYMLDHPDEFYYNYYRYYRTRTAPKVDVRIVIAVTITVISIVQYYGAWSNYKEAINYLCKEQKYRYKAQVIAKEEGLLPVSKRKESGRKSKEEMKQEEEAIIKQIIEDNMDIRGGYRKPSYTDVLWVQLVFSPYYLFLYMKWYLRWIWRFKIKGEEYGDEEKLYLIRKYLKLNSSQFDALEEHEKDKYLHKELWIREKFDEWKKEQDEEMKSKLAESARYKSYRRYMKKGGAGQMTFGPE
ncbi:dnaJ homolog subfamily C member 25-like isoform X1 [Mercenaria mercenaria]|uniref:dnaJ homolog subfamily C member 25-like isoform X1 n=2 Tax=Mercenaria mercenaria TaxID=6596 RepID=UPI001E1DD4EA|nr:dnaJ homolog subfamily C member 25-like isoform X1 [Mercenaria mercenaria]